MDETACGESELEYLRSYTLPTEERLRAACETIAPQGFYIRHPPSPHLLKNFITPDEDLFQTIHMGAATVAKEKWLLLIDGLVKRPFALTFSQLLQLPKTSVTAFHECYGSPVKPPTEAVWRIGNIKWTGVRLSYLLNLAQPFPEARYVWSDGLDRGTFHGVSSDRYEKDLPLEKASQDEVLVAFEINGQPLSKERGGPARLVVPGWFGTNMTKWLYRISLQDKRSPGPYTTTFYNETDPADPEGKRRRPVWKVEVNSIITKPVPEEAFKEGRIAVEGWAWCEEPVVGVLLSADEGKSWKETEITPREDYSWQKWSADIDLKPGDYKLIAQARAASGVQQPMSGRRNHVHTVHIKVVPV
ncbi:molybdopterin binding oxidoreductase [Corynespora cassiicola Philippines]|uniref:Molybdopterin binding oxidoreductase n=1 Tax=Corynespora cassiicola Philippines TaxID=1448308 RepID=A0A2T2N6Q3_CORCC|nr:molybdopterin binding oxidoreductase [Corynespora cassiicola Philippines]